MMEVRPAGSQWTSHPAPGTHKERLLLSPYPKTGAMSQAGVKERKQGAQRRLLRETPEKGGTVRRIIGFLQV